MISARACDCIVLAAGLSSRLGRNKLLEQVAGQPLVRLSVLHALEACRRVILVTGHQSELVEAAVGGLDALELTHNQRFELGMFGSIQTGMRAVASDWFFVVPADLPHINASIYQAVASAAEPESADTVLVPFHGETRGHPVLVPKSLAPALLAMPPDAGPMRRLIEQFGVQRVPVGHPEISQDVDTPEDLERIIGSRSDPDAGA